uniref:HAD hydrolase family protein n=1 Tax=Ruminococcus bicirculans (ex Wegman et al. 2014) TaxID=1160721 RepID=UPI00366F4FB0
IEIFAEAFFKLAVAVIFNAAFFKNGYLENIIVENFNVQLSGKYWTDIMNKGVTKGTALRTIENRIGVRYEETMAFGDYLNDVDMLNNSYYSFAMSNAHESIKKVANFMTGSNNDNSVMKEIEKHCLT